MVYSESHFEHKSSTKTDQLLESPALREVWVQLEQRDLNKREQNILQSILAQPRFQATLLKVRSLPTAELATQLQADLQASYGALQAGCPTSIHDLRQRMRFVDDIPAQDAPLTVSTELSLEEKRLIAERHSAANTRDYLMQTLTAVQSLADVLHERSLDDPNHAALFQLYEQQELRLGRLLVAIEQDANQDLAKAA